MKSQKDRFAEQFADYVKGHLSDSKLRQAELARRSNLSPQTISTIINKKPHHLTGKLLLPERETVDAIADALGRPRDEARLAAGYAPEQNEKEAPALYFTKDPDDELMFNVEKFVRMGSHFEELTLEEQREYSRILAPIAENLERRAKRRK